MYHITYQNEIEKCYKNGRDSLPHFVYRKDAEKQVARIQRKVEKERKAAVEEALRLGVQSKIALEELVAQDNPNIDPLTAQRAASLAGSWQISQEINGLWGDEKATELEALTAEVRFKNERWLAVKYKVGHLDYEQRQVIYRRSHKYGSYNGIGDAIRGEKAYKKLAELLLELDAAKIDRTLRR